MRRNLNKGQKAMVLAMMYPEPWEGRSGQEEQQWKLTGFRWVYPTAIK
jgi:hypothetical protein